MIILLIWGVLFGLIPWSPVLETWLGEPGRDAGIILQTIGLVFLALFLAYCVILAAWRMLQR